MAMHIYIYMVIYALKYVFGMSGLVFLMSGLVFWVSGLVFGCLDLYLGAWNCILGTVYMQGVSTLVWCLYTCRMWLWRARSNHPVVNALVAGFASPWKKKTRPWMFLTCILWLLSLLSDFRVPWYFFPKILSICSNDSASKTRIEIMCKKNVLCCSPSFSKVWFLM